MHKAAQTPKLQAHNGAHTMTNEFINPRNIELTPAQYVRYLRDTHANAKRILSLPVQQWQRGSSHEI
jgi:hypothetical protein